MADSTARPRPNVLLICTDHWPGQLMRPAGHPTVMTPTLEMLARNGTLFSNAYSTCPICVPARRTLMTGLHESSHGLGTNADRPMAGLTTLAQCFRDGGYQAYAVGKLHVSPPRNRIGFDDVILNEEGRPLEDAPGARGDDWDHYVAERGFAGLSFASGMSSNDYLARPWPLPEDCHPTCWAVRQMARTITRRDPTRPAFWYLSFIGPHPPVWPPADYLDMYQHIALPPRVIGAWARDPQQLPYLGRVKNLWHSIATAPEHEIDLARRAFYANLTYIDHQLRVVIGTLREQGLLNDTIIAFTADHGEMLGEHNLWAKQVYYEMSARIPMIILPARGDSRLPAGQRDERLTNLSDMMPTLLDLAGLTPPAGIDGLSLAGKERREVLYGQLGSGVHANRMIRTEHWKLIYYPAGNQSQLFDLKHDPLETRDLAGETEHRPTLARLQGLLVEHLTGDDKKWLRRGKLIGLPMPANAHRDTRDLGNQRGIRYV